jgi:flagellar protein FlbD
MTMNFTEGSHMIELTRLNNEKVVINADLIEFVESTPDTIVTTTTGKKVMVKESVKEVTDKAIEYRRRCLSFGRKRG